MRILARNDAIGTIRVLPGDTLVASYVDPAGNRQVVGRYEVTRPATYDVLLIVEPEPGELGLADGLGAIFGKKAEG